MSVVAAGIQPHWYTGGRWGLLSGAARWFHTILYFPHRRHGRIRRARARAGALAAGRTRAAGEKPSWPATRRYGWHQRHVNGGQPLTAPGADAGLVCRTSPTRAAARGKTDHPFANGWPAFRGRTHNCLPLPDRDSWVVLDEGCLAIMEGRAQSCLVFDISARRNR